MLSTLKEIVISNLFRLSMIWRLGLFNLEKQRRNTVLGWFWLFAQPLIYIFVFGGAVWLGIRAVRDFSQVKPYLLWVASGLYPWFFIKEIFGKGSNAIKNQKGMLKLNVLSPTIAPSLSLMPAFIVFLITYGLMLLIAIPFGGAPTIYWIQLPAIILCMLLFCYCFSLMVSCLSAISKDFANLMKALSTPFFWLSGIIIPLSQADNLLVQVFLAINPIAFLVSAFRNAVFFDQWVFSDFISFLVFLAILILTALAAWFNYHRLKSEVLDAV